MKQVTVNVEVLLSTLKKNREKHRAEALEALEGWREQTFELLTTAAAKLGDGDVGADGLVFEGPPRQYVANYDTAIAMLEWAEETSVVLSQNEFERYVEDTWSWTDNFKMSSSTYGNADNDINALLK